jgi:hypothetical protein
MIYIIIVLVLITFFFKLIYDMYDIARNINFLDAVWQLV